MTLTNLSKAPFPWFGGKRRAAPIVWELLGDVEHYVEPFAGSLAVLLERPHPCNRPYHSETVNDLDGFIVNFWRSIAWSPEATADAAAWPITEADKQARQIALLRWRAEGGTDRLAGDATYHDPVMAGWWAYAVSAQIGAFHGGGPWIADPLTGKITKQARAAAREAGVSRDLPHLVGNGRGVARPQTREAGVSRNLPHLGDDGKGVAHAGNREAGVSRDLPHLGSNGNGVAHAGTREAGVLDAPTDAHGRSALDRTDWGATYHDQTMPELIRWFRHLAARLRHVRILNGDWSRLVTNGASLTIPVRMGGGHVGVFLDPPYGDVRADNLYGTDSLTVADDVRAWCHKHGADPRRRIILAGYDTEHGALEDDGWTVHEWFTDGYLTGGMGNIDGTSQQRRERLWASPACLTADPGPQLEQLGMFG